MTTILGIDPGNRTGVCLIRSTSRTDAPVLVWHDEVYGGSDGFREWWHEKLARPDVDLIVCEDFILREGVHGIDLSPVEVIEALRGLARDAGVKVLYSPPGGRLKRVPDRVMKRMNMYLAGEKNRNAREAVRHALAYLKIDGNHVVLRAFEQD